MDELQGTLPVPGDAQLWELIELNHGNTHEVRPECHCTSDAGWTPVTGCDSRVPDAPGSVYQVLGTAICTAACALGCAFRPLVLAHDLTYNDCSD